MSRKSNKLAPAFKAELIDHTRQLMRQHGFDDEKSFLIAQAIADHMSIVWGGIYIYFPKDIGNKLSARDLFIYNEFNGSNHAELAMKYKVSMQWVYKIIERIRTTDIASRQSSLELEL